MMLQRLRLCAHFSDGTMPAHGTDGLRFAYRRAGGKATFLPPNRCDSAHNLLGLPGPDPGHFLLVQKVTKNTHRGGTLSMGSLPYEPHPRDDTKGAMPPLESPPARPADCPGTPQNFTCAGGVNPPLRQGFRLWRKRLYAGLPARALTKHVSL